MDPVNSIKGGYMRTCFVEVGYTYCKAIVRKIRMTLRRKFEGEVEVRATAADVIHDIIKSKPHHVSHAASHFIQSVDLHEGDHGNIGSKTVWKYSLGGKPMVAKNVLEEIDEEKKYVKYRVIEGDLLNEYKTLTGACHVTPKDNGSCIAKWTLEYEKLHAGIPEPSALLDAWLQATKHIDDHHHGINE
ncbi:MLP-like protein 43 [Bienertia sinuspersici]